MKNKKICMSKSFVAIFSICLIVLSVILLTNYLNAQKLSTNSRASEPNPEETSGRALRPALDSRVSPSTAHSNSEEAEGRCKDHGGIMAPIDINLSRIEDCKKLGKYYYRTEYDIIDTSGAITRVCCKDQSYNIYNYDERSRIDIAEAKCNVYDGRMTYDTTYELECKTLGKEYYNPDDNIHVGDDTSHCCKRNIYIPTPMPRITYEEALSMQIPTEKADVLCDNVGGQITYHTPDTNGYSCSDSGYYDTIPRIVVPDFGFCCKMSDPIPVTEAKLKCDAVKGKITFDIYDALGKPIGCQKLNVGKRYGEEGWYIADKKINIAGEGLCCRPILAVL